MSQLPALGAAPIVAATVQRGAGKPAPDAENLPGEPAPADGLTQGLRRAGEGGTGPATAFAALMQTEGQPKEDSAPPQPVPVEAAPTEAERLSESEIAALAGPGPVEPGKTAPLPERSGGADIPNGGLNRSGTLGGTAVAQRDTNIPDTDGPKPQPDSTRPTDDGPAAEVWGTRVERAAGRRVLQNGTPLAALPGEPARPPAGMAMSNSADLHTKGSGAPHWQPAGPAQAAMPAAADSGTPRSLPATSAQALAAALQPVAQAVPSQAPKALARALANAGTITDSTQVTERGADAERQTRAPSPAQVPTGAGLPVAAPSGASAPKTLTPQPITFEESMARASEADPMPLGGEVSRSERAETALQTGPLRPVAAQPQMPAQIGSQIASAARQVAPGSIDLQLHPEELGRLRMQFEISEQTLVVAISADRPETLDLMRRHIDQLAREMQTLGYRDVSFQFEGDGRPDAETRPGQSAPARGAASLSGDEPPLSSPPSVLPRPAPGHGQSGLDLRI